MGGGGGWRVQDKRGQSRVRGGKRLREERKVIRERHEERRPHHKMGESGSHCL